MKRGKRILEALNLLRLEVARMATELDALTAQVKANTDLEASVVTLIAGMAAKIKEEVDALAAAGVDTKKLQDLTSQLAASAAPLAAAVLANTSVAPPVPPVQ
jgi:isopropylmalate/homocitrate/citramalate synthase